MPASVAYAEYPSVVQSVTSRYALVCGKMGEDCEWIPSPARLPGRPPYDLIHPVLPLARTHRVALPAIRRRYRHFRPDSPHRSNLLTLEDLVSFEDA